MAIHSSAQTVFIFAYIEGIRLDIDGVAGGTRGMGMGRIGEVGDRASEGQAARVYVSV